MTHTQILTDNACTLPFYVKFVTACLNNHQSTITPDTGMHKSQATELYTVAPNTCRASVWNMLHVTLLESRIP